MTVQAGTTERVTIESVSEEDPKIWPWLSAVDYDMASAFAPDHSPPHRCGYFTYFIEYVSSTAADIDADEA